MKLEEVSKEEDTMKFRRLVVMGEVVRQDGTVKYVECAIRPRDLTDETVDYLKALAAGKIEEHEAVAAQPQPVQVFKL